MTAADPARLAQQLTEENLRFGQDREHHFRAGETKPATIGEPYFLNGDNGWGVLLVHGLMAAPEEVREWAEDLHRQGYTVYAPRLAGHGTSADDLASRTAEEWMDSVERGRRILHSAGCGRIAIAGFSTGGAVALASVIRQPEAYAALISISAPLRFKSWKASVAEPVDLWNRLLDRLGINAWRQDFVHNDADNPQINYRRCPVHSIVQIRRLMRAVRRGLPGIRIPALVMHADADPKVDVRGGREIYRRLGSATKRYREVAFHRHGIVRGEIGRQLFRESGRFLGHIRHGKGS
ncbi:carboxylesterase [Fluviicoccus keumensis]|uniref:Carboxylesterase n=1 Tax=Fluviicoccus keumensis TaxID=1435465 RepID=A0A4Q7ZA14_9GAMM|nr:alpha/beta fold hydrolase [Fluviicoccus keumensis]RZU47378.1 carboxylesterase [Fluviicoccus keumensis]